MYFKQKVFLKIINPLNAIKSFFDISFIELVNQKR